MMLHWKRAALTRQQEAAEFIFQNSPDAFFVLRDGKITECNPATARLLKIPLDQVVGISPPQFSPEFQPCGRTSADLAGEMISTALQKGQHSFEWTIKRGDGSPLLVRVTLIAGALNGAPVLCVTWQDMAETQALREAERQSKARQDAIASAHADALGRLAEGLRGLSDGNLTCRLEGAFAAESDTIRVDFNDAAAKLRGAMEGVAKAVTTLRSGANEIASASDDLSRRTEQQAASLEETAAALDEITATVKKTAEGAHQARQVVSTAKANAEHSGKVVGQAVEAMTAIEQSSRQVNQIIGVIDEIAFQTNLLALNAGVEAARAGEAGRGFAVVASEVRALAQRSAEAAKEIKTLIAASGQQVEQGVALVGETGKSLGLIVTHVAEINGIVSAIATSAQEQSVGLDQVNTSLNQMDQVTQKNAAMAEESAAASRNLASETEALKRLVGQFEIGGPDFVTDRTPQRNRLVSRPAPMMKAPGRDGSALRKPEPEGAGWEEF